ncbi:MAG TPA: hypothetical protein VFF30_01590 [Nitrososphaerales archaeon]|nr:hypothetical protein [Nitrososphaerales archaeon]
MKHIIIASILVVALSVLSAALVVSIALPSQGASQIQVQSSLAGSTPNTFISGVPSGGVPWVVAAGEAGLSPNGRLHVNIVGLLITGTGTALDGTTGPVSSVLASLVCQNSGVVASTSAVPLDSKGDARINQVIQLPSTCFGPVILVRISGLASSDPWIAVTGFTT